MNPKTILAFLFVCVLAASAGATTYKINWVKIYVDGKIVDEADESGGEITANPGQQVRVKWWFDNICNVTLDYDVAVRVFDIISGDDIYVHESHEINANDDSVQSLSFNIPDNANEDVYDMVMDITGDTGTNVTEQTITYDFVVELPTINDMLGGDAGMMSKFINTTNQVVQTVGLISEQLNKSLKYGDAYSNCSYNQGILEERLQNCNDTLSEYEQCLMDMQTFKDMSVQCSTQIENMLSQDQCTEQTQQELKSQKNSAFGWILAMACVGFVGYHFVKKREENREKPPGPRMPGKF